MAVLMAAEPVVRSHDTYYPYRQNSAFFYLTGLDQADDTLVLAKRQGVVVVTLLTKPMSDHDVIWHSPRMDIAALQRCFVDGDVSVDQQLLEQLPAKVYGLQGQSQRLISSSAVEEVLALDPWIDAMRVIKDADEIEVIREAVNITCQAHEALMRRCVQAGFEYDLDRLFTAEVVLKGATPAYANIVASGRHGCILHYDRCDQPLQGLVLVDAGAEYQGYAGDISRTYPACGRFTPAQASIYQLVLDSQSAAIATLKPGVTFTEIEDVVVRRLTAGLVDLGILQGEVEDLVDRQAYRPYYMHRFGHFLGLDVHDSHPFTDEVVLAPGMVLTVEPGLYLRAHEQLDPKWHDIAVRIEDDILITADGHEVLSGSLAKSIEDIERCMRYEHL